MEHQLPVQFQLEKIYRDIGKHLNRTQDRHNSFFIATSPDLE